MPNPLAFYITLHNSGHPWFTAPFTFHETPNTPNSTDIRVQEIILPILCSGVVLTPFGLPISDNCFGQVWIEIGPLLLNLKPKLCSLLFENPSHLLWFVFLLLKQVGPMEEVGVAPTANLHEEKSQNGESKQGMSPTLRQGPCLSSPLHLP